MPAQGGEALATVRTGDDFAGGTDAARRPGRSGGVRAPAVPTTRQQRPDRVIPVCRAGASAAAAPWGAPPAPSARTGRSAM